MRTTGTHGAIRALAVLVIAVAIGIIARAAPAAAAPPSLAPQIAATKAEQAQGQAMVAQMHADLMAQMSQYTALCAALQQTQREVSQNTSELAKLDSELTTRQAELDARACLLYQSRGDHIAELFMSSSLPEFVRRAEYLLRLSEYDSALIEEVASTRAQGERMRAYLTAREADLTAQQRKADEERVKILARLAVSEAAVKAAGADLSGLLAQQEAQTAAATVPIAGVVTSGGVVSATGVVPAGGRHAPEGGFDQNTLITDANYVAVDSMSAADVQATLDTLNGPLKRYTAPDYNGQIKTAAQMIYEAAKAWGISPKVVLATLQKEQSLLNETNPTQKDFDWALGMGWSDSRKLLKYQGFGKQIWFGTYLLAKLQRGWHPGASQWIDGTRVYPTNKATWALYQYTPHFGGCTSFWMIWWRHFGDPLL